MPGPGVSGQQGRELPAVEPPKPAPKSPEELVEAHRRCPSCWGNGNGIGTATATVGKTRYYRCQSHVGGQFYGDKPEDHGKVVGGGCAHTWNVKLAVVETVLVEKRVVAVSMRDVQIEER